MKRLLYVAILIAVSIAGGYLLVEDYTVIDLERSAEFNGGKIGRINEAC